MRHAFFGLLSYLALAAIIAYQFLYLPPPFNFIFDMYFLIWAGEFIFSWYAVYYLYSRGPKHTSELFRLGVALIVNAALLMAMSKFYIGRTESFLGQSGSQNVPFLKLALAAFDVSQNLISFGLAAFGANLSATALTNRWNKRLHG